MWPYKQVDGKNIPLPLDLDTSEIDAFNEGKEGAAILSWLPRQIRYIVGLNSPFADEQDSDATRPDINGQNGLVNNPANRDALMLITGEVKLPSVDIVLGNFLWLSNQCENQHPKARRYGIGRPLYYKVDFGEVDQVKVDLGKLREEMYKYAKTADLEEMMAHADYLGISFIHEETQQDREWDAIREDYKEIAISDPIGFNKSANNPKIKMMYVIKRLQQAGKIGINAVQNGQAHWMDTRRLIATLPPDRQPVEFLAEYALTGEGDVFAKQVQQFNSFANMQL